MFGLRFVYFALAALLCATANVAAIPIPQSHPGDIIHASHGPQPAHPPPVHHDSVRVTVQDGRSAHINAATIHSNYGHALLDFGKNHDQLGQHLKDKGETERAAEQFDKARQLKERGQKHIEAADMHYLGAQHISGHNASRTENANSSAENASFAHQALRSASRHYKRAVQFQRQGSYEAAKTSLDSGRAVLDISNLHSQVSLNHQMHATSHIENLVSK